MQFIEMHFLIILFLLLNKRVHTREVLFTETSVIIHGTLSSISDIPTTKPAPQERCLRLQCKFICSNGNHSSIERDVKSARSNECEFINELHLYNYRFPRKMLPKRLLGLIAEKVQHLFIYSSDVENIAAGAFESKNLIAVHLEDLKLKFLDQNMFTKVNQKLSSFTLIQNTLQLQHINENFLENIKYQIKKLTIQTGLMELKNITGSQFLLNSLEEVDFSHNNFEGRLLVESFSQLSVVEKLNLSHAEITFLPEFIFVDIVRTLKLLDLSNNKLTFISQTIFGWRKPTKGLTLFLDGNHWECTCDLQKEMSMLLVYQQPNNYCETSNQELCPLLSSTASATDYSTQSKFNGMQGNKVETETTQIVQTTDLILPPSALELSAYATAHDLECHKDNAKLETENLSLHWPNTQFDIIRKKVCEVDIVVKTNSNGSYGILWFSKVTLQYYKMETNHNEYGLGCYGRLERVTTINHLLPDMSYTFCLILKDQLTVSPFSCKSMYIDGNLEIKYNAWLSTSMKATGISIIVIGIVLFAFVGIFLIFVILKQKPSLLKGSKRVATQRSDSSNIIVFPEDKTLQKFKLVEEQLASRKSRMPFQRLSSSVSLNSLESTQSYMNPENLNLYEVIPAHRTSVDVRYAEVPFKRKRSSNDPLPEIPKKVEENTSPGSSKKLEVRKDQFYENEISIYM